LKFGTLVKAQTSGTCVYAPDALSRTCTGYNVKCVVNSNQSNIWCCDLQADCDALQSAPPTCASQNSAAQCYPSNYVCLPQNPPISPNIGCGTTEQCGVGCVASTTTTTAATAIPPPTVDCEDTGDPEFHSLRPYQASPCNASVSDTALFCGDTLTFTDNIEETFPPYVSGCYSTSPGNVRCNYKEHQNPIITINLSGAELPIMGNTEDVINSQPNSAETLNDAGKVNGYVSWYLNGVINRAEYPLLDVDNDCIGDSGVAGMCSNTLAGFCLSHTLIPIPDPLTVKPDGKSTCGSTKVCCVTTNPLAEKVDMLDRDKLINYSGPINKLLPQEIQQQQRAQTVKDAVASVENDAGIRHNQVVGCTFGINIPLLGQLFAVPAPCYDLKLGLLTSIVIDRHRLSEWENRYPPIRSEYPSYIDYQAAYERWRGKGCVVAKVPEFIPIVGGKGFIFCVENPFNPNYIAALYPYIPLSSTEDRKGAAQGGATLGPPPSGVVISNVVITSTAADLFFSHMEETVSLATQLQTTYIPKDVSPITPGNSVPPQIGGSCKIIDVRSGAGDNLFAGDITVNINYDAAFSCDFKVPYCDKSCGWNGCHATESGGYCCTGPTLANPIPPPCSDDPIRQQSCIKSIPITVNMTTKTPLVDDIWTRLVEGSSSVFRRMFPKLGAGNQLGEVKDIPASTAVTYSGSVNGNNQFTGTGQLNFPHIGGISDYFLKGIQTMLRPKGFGEPITFGDISINPPIPGVLDCDQSAPDIPLPNTISKEDLHQLAIRMEGQEGDHVLECYNDAARKSLAAGISPAFTFLIWINESGGSNYNISNQDFGVNDSSVVGFTAQITRFLGYPSAYKNTFPQCFGKGRSDTEVFFDLYYLGLVGGQCPYMANNPYLELVNVLWNAYTSCPFTGYPFSSSCY
jgi:hypothetical protein